MPVQLLFLLAELCALASLGPVSLIAANWLKVYTEFVARHGHNTQL